MDTWQHLLIIREEYFLGSSSKKKFHENYGIRIQILKSKEKKRINQNFQIKTILVENIKAQKDDIPICLNLKKKMYEKMTNN